MSDRLDRRNSLNKDKNNTKGTRRSRSTDPNSQVLNSSRHNINLNNSSKLSNGKRNNNDSMSSHKTKARTDFFKQDINIHNDVNTTYKKVRKPLKAKKKSKKSCW